jgi:hypothetical protein
MYFRQLKFYILNYRSNSTQVMFYQLFYKIYIIKVQKERGGGRRGAKRLQGLLSKSKNAKRLTEMYFYHSTEVHTIGKNQKFCFKQSTDKK